jgi:hypothetical protein
MTTNNRSAIVATLLAAACLAVTGCSFERGPIAAATDAESAALDRQARQLQWEAMLLSADIDRPEAVFEAHIDPEVAEEVYTDCMREAGFSDWRRVEDNTLGTRVLSERLAGYACESRFPLPASEYGLYSTGTLDAVYDYYRDSLIPCLKGAGVDVGGVPTRDNFALGNFYGKQWTPYGHDVGVTDEEARLISQRCGDLTTEILESE